MNIATRQLRELELFDSIGAPVLSLYLPVSPGSSADALTVATRLVRALGADLPESSQADLAREMELVRDYVGSLVAAPRSLAIFCCRRRGFFRVIRLDEAVEPTAFWQQSVHTGRLRQLMEDGPRLEPTVGSA
jgi:hypothetical protein